METRIPHWLSKQAYLSPEKRAIETTDGSTLSFLELAEKSKAFARKLASLGIGQGERVAVLSTNDVQMVITVHALSYLQAVAVMINTKLSKQEIMYQLETSHTMLLLHTEALRKEKQLPFVHAYTFQDVQALEEEEVTLANELHLDTPFTMMFTSGTTGKPKAVIHTYGNHWWSAVGSMLNLGLDKQDKWLLILPIFHVGGLSVLMRSVIYGMEVFLMEKYDATILYNALKEKQITIASIVTVMLKDMMDQLGTEELPESVRCLLLGGGSVPRPLLKKVKEKNLPLFQSYGMTETSSQIVTLSEEDSLRKIGSAGKPLFPAAVQIMAPDEAHIGEIAVKGPMVFGGYDRNKEANQKAFSEDWFKTGDLGYLDKDGFLFVVERRTDLIISGGENIYPTEVEDVFLGMLGVLEVAVVGKPDERWGKVPVACVVSNEKYLDTEKLLRKAKEKLASYKVPKEIHMLAELPKTASNKIMRHQLVNEITKK